MNPQFLTTTELLLIAGAAIGVIGIVVFGILYVRAAERLHSYLKAEFPALFPFPSNYDPFFFIIPPLFTRQPRLDYLILGIRQIECTEPRFLNLLGAARWRLIVCGMSFVMLVLSLSILSRLLRAP